MMKRLTVIIAFMLCVGSVMAQYEKGECYFRPYMGLMFSNMESKAFRSSCDLKWKVNMTLGGQFEWQLLKSSSLLMDANYRRQGCMIDYKGYYGNTDGDDKMTVDFLNFGLQSKMYLKPNLSARVGIELMSKVGNLTTHWMKRIRRAVVRLLTRLCGAFLSVSRLNTRTLLLVLRIILTGIAFVMLFLLMTACIVRGNHGVSLYIFIRLILLADIPFH